LASSTGWASPCQTDPIGFTTIKCNILVFKMARFGPQRRTQFEAPFSVTADDFTARVDLAQPQVLHERGQNLGLRLCTTTIYNIRIVQERAE
jgi:hypothetical protein